MKILHTADFHLHSRHMHRLDALTQVLNTGKNHEIDLMIIAGDLFDNEVEADKLRPGLRNSFRNLPFQVLAIPGNHDQRAYSREQFFGESFRAETRSPFSVLDYPDTRLVMVPYFTGSIIPLISQLQQQVVPDRLNILVLHCTWSLPHHTSQDFGCEQDHRYLPVTPSLLDSLGYDLLLAGHFHSGHRHHSLPRGGVFVYSGSPVPISGREQGRRSVNLVENGHCRSLDLEVPYHDTISMNISPGQEQDAITRLLRQLEDHPPHLCNPLIRVEGFTALDEAEFHQALKVSLHNRSLEIESTCRSVGTILQDPLYLQVLQKLKNLTLPQDLRQRTQDLVLDAFSRQELGQP